MKWLELLKEAVRTVPRVAVLRTSGNPIHANFWTNLQVAARALRVTLQSLDMRGPDDLERAFAAMRTERARALVVLPDALFSFHLKRILELTVHSRLPAMSESTEFADAGGLMAYGARDADLYRRAATYVDKILKGAKPADLPVEEPMRFELVINLKTAKALHLRIPRSVLIRADRLIE